MGGLGGGRRRAFRSRHRTPMGEGGRLAIIFGSLALILFVFAVMLGNHLRNLAEGAPIGTDGEDTTKAEIYYANAPDEVIARGIVFGENYFAEAPETTVTEDSDEEHNDTSPLLDEIEYDAVSVVLR